MNPNQEYASLRRYVDQPRETTFSKADVERWNKSRHAAPRPSSALDFPAWLIRITNKVIFAAAVIAILLSAFIVGEIICAFVSGRVQAVLDAMKVSQ